MVRSVEAVTIREDAVDLAVSAVRYWPLDPIPGLLTTEDPITQGLELRLPNAPDMGAGTAVEARRAVLRVRVPSWDVFRLTLWPGEAWGPAADGEGDGILSAPDPRRPDGWHFEVEEDEQWVTIRTNAKSLAIRRRPFGWRLTGTKDRLLALSGGDLRQVAGFALAPAMAFGDGMAWCNLELRHGETVVGLGEHFGPLPKGGARLELLANDALGAGTGQAYKSAPVFHSSAGYSGFLHTPGPVVADVGARYPGLLGLESEEERLDLFLLAGPTPRARLGGLARLIGQAPVPPTWAFGVWMSRCRYRDLGELNEAATGMRAHGVPCDVLHLDPDWLERDLLNCDFAWSEAKFGDPAELIAKLAADGYHLSLWELPYLDPSSPLHAEAQRLGYLVLSASGGLAAARVLPRDGRPRALVDFSNPAARQWWKGLHSPLLRLGAGAFTTDFGEGLPDDAVMADGRSGRAWRNLYPLWYNRTVSEALSEHAVTEGGEPGLVWGRSGWAGSQRYPAQWGGDAESSVAGMAATLRAGLSWAMSAPGLWGHDIGGFYGPGPSPELYVRWAQWGCLSPMARFHGLGPREPWEYGERALRIVTEFARLRYRLLPYLLSIAGEATRFGLPVMRPICLEYPGQLAHWSVDTEYLLGSDLLVVPVLDDSPGPVAVRCVLPPGHWMDLSSGRDHRGPAEIVVQAPLERLPLFVRAGAVIPMWEAEVPHTGAYCEATWTMHCWGARPGPPTVIYDGDHQRGYMLEAGAAALRCDEGQPRASAAVLHLPGELDRQLALVRGEVFA